MPTSKECVCCRECPPAVATHPEGFITEHTDFAAICLQLCVLRVAFWALQEEERHPAPGENNLILPLMMSSNLNEALVASSIVVCITGTSSTASFS
ncbi:hypothetical protein HPB47_004354 [Ixodes persulcatus]|uniref:Uncharacterized protein n=1 Tax=Ixodes persulcatus TaxID=34615 RepID=A0AC60PG38_IXOPE|nr:hypothetical protein HPB47_004354 [Ixodes persulcatus]